MTPRPFSNDIVAARLRMISDLLAQLRDMGAVTRERLEAEPLTRAAAERFIQSIVDMAIDVNSHIAVTRFDRAPTNGKESFLLAAQAGALDDELAEALVDAVKMRNVLVHQYVSIDIGLVASAVSKVVELFDAYVRQAAAYSLELAGGEQ